MYSLAFVFRLTSCLVVTVLLCTACKENSITEYTAPKETAKIVSMEEEAPSSSTASSNHTPAAWKPAPQWVTTPPPPMCLASWRAEAPDEGHRHVDITVTAFPGSVGGLLANINRWRGQIHLQPLDADALAAVRQPMVLSGAEGTYVRLIHPGPEGASILAGTVSQNDQTWFFKLMGPTDLVLNEESAFQTFLQSIQFSTTEL